VYEDRLAVAVRGCPKPPPTRITLTFPAITSADEVWLVAAGAAKASAIGMALSGAGRMQIPAAGAQGGIRTLWMLDPSAAARWTAR
jgi:6-phosphogluconolactonase